MNITIVSGTIDRPPKATTFASGSQKVEFTLKETVNQGAKSFIKYHHVAAWDQEAQDIIDSPERFARGVYMVVAGRMSSKLWTNKSGQDKILTEITMKQDVLCDPAMQSAFADMVSTGQCMLFPSVPAEKKTEPDDDDDLPF